VVRLFAELAANTISSPHDGKTLYDELLAALPPLLFSPSQANNMDDSAADDQTLDPTPTDPVVQGWPTKAVRMIVNNARAHISSGGGGHGDPTKIFLSPGERHVLGACVSLVRSVHWSVYEERGEEFARTTAAVRNVTNDLLTTYEDDVVQELADLSRIPPSTPRRKDNVPTKRKAAEGAREEGGGKLLTSVQNTRATSHRA
jgi:hypothetical protein